MDLDEVGMNIAPKIASRLGNDRTYIVDPSTQFENGKNI